MKKALITGITGVDGACLTRFRLEKGYEVHGIIRLTRSSITDQLDAIYRDAYKTGARLFLHHENLANGTGTPDGIPRGLLDNSRIQSPGLSAKIKLPEGIISTYECYLSSPADCWEGTHS